MTRNLDSDTANQEKDFQTFTFDFLMMNDLEKSKYEEMWSHSSYRAFSPGFTVIDHFFKQLQEQIREGDSIIDFGCGTGTASIRFFLKGLSVHMVDIARNCLDEEVSNLMSLSFGKIQFLEACLWDLPDTLGQADWIYCCDVMEHIPEEYVDAVLAQMAKRTKKGGFLQIFLREDNFGGLIGKKLHLTVRPKKWWLKKIRAYWEIEEFGPKRAGYFFSVFLKSISS